VYEAVRPEFEAGLELGRQALSHLGVDVGEIQRFSDRVRRELYSPMTDRSADEDLLLQLRRTSQMIDTEWIRLPKESALAGKTIGDLRIRSRTGASVVSIIRGGDVLPNPGPEVAFEPEDVVGAVGTPNQRAAFRALAQGE
jgi:CPA2 family monovalent cation:H+ antiporter-2